ncbi:MAG: hypothetical protein RLZZ350_1853 [Verrucomicrobiota bacterium]|jgi:hypothetical protein
MKSKSLLTTSAPLLKNWSWELVVSLNQGACKRGGAQHGFNRETIVSTASQWADTHQQSLSFHELAEFLQQCHRNNPFLFLNEHTFAEIGRQAAISHFAKIPKGKRQEIAGTLSDYILGLLERDAVEEIIASLESEVELRAGDRVKTLRGSLAGVVREVLADGRVTWQPDGSDSELISPPGGVIPV